MFDYECCGFKETEVVKTFAVEGIFFSVTTPSRIANAVSAMFCQNVVENFICVST